MERVGGGTRIVRRRTNYVSSSFITDCIVSEVLLRIPAKSVLRFKSVCKQWCSIIKDPNFSHEHYYHLRKNPSVSFAAYYRGDCIRREYDHLTTFEDEGKLTVSTVMAIPTRKPEDAGWFSMVVCNGLLCFYSCHIYICNPTTKELVILPVKADVALSEAFGFGYDSVNRQYKVVQLLSQLDDENPLMDVVLNVYTLGDACKSWRTTSLVANDKDFPRCYGSSLNDRGRHVNGSIYWLILREYKLYNYQHRKHIAVLCFDVHDEKFKRIKLPDGLIFLGKFQLISMLVELRVNRFGIVRLDHQQHTMDIWMLAKEDSTQDLWTKEYRVDVSAITRDYFYDDGYFSLQIMREKFLLMTPRGLVSYEVQNNKIEQVLENSRKDLDEVEVYMQTMISLYDMGFTSLAVKRSVAGKNIHWQHCAVNSKLNVHAVNSKLNVQSFYRAVILVVNAFYYGVQLMKGFKFKIYSQGKA